MSAVFASRVGPSARRLLLLALANRLNKDTEQCNPSMETLAVDVGVTVGQAQRLMASLKRDGLVSVLRNAKGGGHLTPHYRLHFDSIAAWTGDCVDATPRGCTDAPPARSKYDDGDGIPAAQGPHASHPRGSADAVPGAAPMQPKPELNQKLEPELNRSVVAVAPTAGAVGTAPALTLDQWISAEKAAGHQLFPDGAELHVYCDGVGIPKNFRVLAWEAFKQIFQGGGQRAATVSTNWPQSLLTHVQRNWLKLWWFETSSGTFVLTTAGEQARLAYEARHAEA